MTDLLEPALIVILWDDTIISLPLSTLDSDGRTPAAYAKCGVLGEWAEKCSEEVALRVEEFFVVEVEAEVACAWWCLKVEDALRKSGLADAETLEPDANADVDAEVIQAI
jgi:hypothetical protein